MYLYAYNAVQGNQLPLFGDLLAAKPAAAKAAEIHEFSVQAGGGPV
jgi:hypothetical protein